MTHRPIRTRYSPVIPLLLAGLTAGCANPYVAGYAGDRLTPLLPSDPVRVLGADEDDPIAIARLDAEHQAVTSQARLLGTATTIAARPLRDAVAIDAARQLGANTVLYRFAYLNSTVETDIRTTRTQTQAPHKCTCRRRDCKCANTRTTRHATDTTHHWFVYRAHFFGPPTPSDPITP